MLPEITLNRNYSMATRDGYDELEHGDATTLRWGQLDQVVLADESAFPHAPNLPLS